MRPLCVLHYCVCDGQLGKLILVPDTGTPKVYHGLSGSPILIYMRIPSLLHVVNYCFCSGVRTSIVDACLFLECEAIDVLDRYTKVLECIVRLTFTKLHLDRHKVIDLEAFASICIGEV